MRITMKVKGKYTIPSLVLFIVGFLVAFAFQHTHALVVDDDRGVQEWEQTFYYRQQLIQFEDNNNQLQQEIDALRLNLIQLEDDLRSEEHTSELQSRGHLVCRLLLEKTK